MDLKQFDVLLHDTEVKLKRLKALYDQWFQGIERLEPLVARKDLDRTFVLLAKERPRNTAARFKLTQLKARYSTYVIYWQRIARQMEEGTYARDLRRARRRRGSSNKASDEHVDVEVKEYELDLDSAELFPEDEISSVLEALATRQSPPTPATPPTRRVFSAFSPMATGRASQRPASTDELPAEDTQPNATNPYANQGVVASFGKPKNAPPPENVSKRPTPREPMRPSGARPKPPSPPQASPRPAPQAPRPASPRKDNMERLYEDYLAARRRNNEPVDNVQKEKLAESVAKMRSKLSSKHAGKTIDFEVVVLNGRVGLKPKIE